MKRPPASTRWCPPCARCAARPAAGPACLRRPTLAPVLQRALQEPRPRRLGERNPIASRSSPTRLPTTNQADAAHSNCSNAPDAFSDGAEPIKQPTRIRLRRSAGGARQRGYCRRSEARNSAQGLFPRPPRPSRGAPKALGGGSSSELAVAVLVLLAAAAGQGSLRPTCATARRRASPGRSPGPRCRPR